MNVKKARRFRKTLRQFERLIENQEKNCCSGVSLPQCHVLLEIEENGRATTGELAKSLGLDKSTLSRTIDGLVSRGLIDRLSNPADRRYIPLILTKKGKDVCDAINRVSDAYYGKVLEQLPDNRINRVLDNFAILVQAFLDHKSRFETESECYAHSHDGRERGK